MSMGDGKAINVVEYLDNLIEKGKATTGAIRPLKIAFSKVMQVIEGESWENADVKAIDIEDYMSRFGVLTMGKYASDSLITYKSRFNKAVTWYLQFLDKPGWTPEVQRRNRTPKTAIKSKIMVKADQTETRQEEPTASIEVSTLPTKDRIIYPYPLVSGEVVQFSLPIKLSKVDARRIGLFIESIAMDEVKDE